MKNHNLGDSVRSELSTNPSESAVEQNIRPGLPNTTRSTVTFSLSLSSAEKKNHFLSDGLE